MATAFNKNVHSQSPITDTTDGTMVEPSGDEMNGEGRVEGREDSSGENSSNLSMLRLAAETIFGGDQEKKLGGKKRQREEPEDSWATGESDEERSTATPPRPKMSTVDTNMDLQSAIDTADGIILIEQGKSITVESRDDGMNGGERVERQDNSRADGTNCEDKGTRVRGKNGQREGPENGWATGECGVERSMAALPRPKISTVVPSKEHHTSSSPISLSDSSPQAAQCTAWEDESEMLIRNWPHQTNLPDLLKTARQLPGNALFNLPRRMIRTHTRVTKEQIVDMLTELQLGQMLTGNLVNYFLSRMAMHNDVRLIHTDWYDSSQPDLSILAGKLMKLILDLVPGTRVLIPCFHNSHWSCIEVDLHEATILHYDSLLGAGHCSSTKGWEVKAGCRHCKRVGDIFSHTSISVAQGGWIFCTPECQQQENGDDCGVFMLNTLQRRAQMLELHYNFSPDQYRFNMAIRFVQDILTGKRTEDVIQATSSDKSRVHFEWVQEPTSHEDEDITSQGTDEEQWALFETIHQSEGWVYQLRRLEREEHHDWTGFKGNSRLLQLAANIASPLTFIELKRQLAELRRDQPRPRVSSNHLQGAYFAGVWHESNTLRSSMCVRLISWVFRNEVVQRMTREKERTHKKQKANKDGAQGNKKGDYQTTKKKAIDSLIKEVDREAGKDIATTSNPPTLSLAVDATRATANVAVDDMERRIKAWYQMGGSWSRLATATGSPACLCLLPSGTNIVPGQPPIYASEYRDLPMKQAELLGTLLSILRPRMNGFFPKELYEAFLRSTPPGRFFQIESWSDERIRNQTLDSDGLARAFELQPEELV
jgi:hypothetical protein